MEEQRQSERYAVSPSPKPVSDWPMPAAPAVGSHRQHAVAEQAAPSDNIVSGRSHGRHGPANHGHMRAPAYEGAGQSAAKAAGPVSDMNSWGGDDPEPAKSVVRRSPDGWPPDALVELLQEPLMGAGARDLSGSLDGLPVQPAAMAALPNGSPESVPGEYPFASPINRGLAVRRSSQGGGAPVQGLRSPGEVFGRGGRMLASPPYAIPMSRGGLNVQASWMPLGLGPTSPPGMEEKTGPGHSPIGINASIQAQSAMLREMYPNAVAGGPLALP